MSSNVLWFSELGLADLEQVGGKNSSLGEMVSNLANLGVRVPDGFATTAEAYRRFIGDTGLAETISSRLADLDTDDVQELARAGQEIRDAVVTQFFPADLEAEIRSAYVCGAAGDLFERAGHRGDLDCDPGGVRLAVQRPRDRLPGAPRF